ncbi:hypothetical protein [Streptomyces pinistramenti]|uniref:hypothetical protein n=1 Tax=Streptomyces pinistramenti TaxID=2884812 RepID=UPI001D0832C1|nr:hypothetical protein [Streptomyces pinistramenti]MCB5907088.1 hypothetical protein [Streptomyces pinistramenti]
MTRTTKTETKTRSRRRVAVTGALGVAALALAAVPAHAKGAVDLTAPHTAAVGKTFTVTAHGNDDAASYMRICLEDRSGGHAWHQVACGATVARDAGTEARVAAHTKGAHRGSLEFRAVMYGLTSPHAHPVRWRTSNVATVQVR